MKKSILLITAFMILGATVFAQVNLLETVNPSLNAKNNEDLTQGCWYWTTYQASAGGNMIAATPGQGDGDNFCGKVVDPGKTDASLFKWGAVHQAKPVIQGRTYYYTYWIKTDADNKAIGVRVNYDSAELDGWQGGTSKENTINITDGWSMVGFYVTPDLTKDGNVVTSLKLIICGASTPGDFYFDNFIMSEGYITDNREARRNELSVSVAPDGSKLAILGDVNNTYSIFNMAGQKVQTGRVSGENQTLLINDLQAGNIYFIQIDDTVLKFIK